MKIQISLLLFCIIAVLSCTKRSNINTKNEKVFMDADSNRYHAKVMLDGKLWLTENLNSKVENTFCHQDSSQLCEKYGRLYTWETAKNVCSALGNDWRLPTNEEWQALAKAYGGVVDDSNDNGKSAYAKLIEGGDSGFNALLGGNREADGSYARLNAHGFYWTASEHDSNEAWFYNFGNGSKLLNRHAGDKRRAISVRCINNSMN